MSNGIETTCDGHIMTSQTQRGTSFVINVNKPPKNVKNKSYVYDSRTYNILQYNRDILTVGDPAENYKSVVYDDMGIISVCPNKSVSLHAMNDGPDIECSQLIEGTMINLFMDRDNKWNIHTRGAIGGNYFYYRNQYYMDQFSDARQVSFRHMFIEALGGNDRIDLNSLEVLDDLDKNAVYTFSMQHPDNHIVLPVKSPRLYLTHMTYIDGDRVTCMTAHQAPPLTGLAKSMIMVPQIYPIQETIQETMNKLCGIQVDYTMTGLVFYDRGTGNRAVYIAPNYKEMKSIRGNNPNLQYQYICLRRVKKVDEFIKYFPCYSKIFYNFYLQYKQFMQNVHQSYYNFYVKKTPEKISNKYWSYVNRLHRDVYIPSVRNGDNDIISISRVYEFFDKMSPGEVLYALNYDNRKITKDVK